ncbi:hypothetical protein PC129_g16460 [Phytophthora cactorum]|uniref:Uncharacterized protein n=1 Tax=Phytophthora cactorum TaxID=29920 RepID=A0A329SP17_9STRA|nr:hypothetical protein Pcac1_g52 [Phytophthora cactorum]KAG2804011.1 hypothetical protein PC111_g18446 [Phytophthora cactorum]KAG2806796.1 hypothetical protein PC112_g17696 [Phytophthora cactorum]KAG2847941.1 hypothetical protein PC113_g17672 [Phytophthora cactorum]KAG2882923.1 hypothetical protein PC114_g20795 [Phytophthora cactorum]
MVDSSFNIRKLSQHLLHNRRGQGARQSADNVAGLATARANDVLSHEEAEHLIRSLTGIAGGRPLVEKLLEELRARNFALRNQPPPPPNDPRDGDDSSAGHSEATSSQLSMLDNQHPGDRYDDKDLAEHTKTLQNTPDIKLPNLSKKKDY